MNETDELRRLLDERGVEWWNQTDPEPQTVTMARLGDQLIEYHENVNGTMGYHVWNMHELTPEQAVEATLGRGTCRITDSGPWGYPYVCSACGASNETSYRVMHKLLHDIEEEFKEQEQAHNFAYSQVYDFASGIYGQLLDFEKMEERQDEMAEHGWVKLPMDGEAPSKQLAEWIERRGLVTGPLDANGELWHSGDMSDSNWGAIEYITFQDGMWFVSGHDTSAPWVPADSIRHYHEPDTWERIIEDACKRAVDGYPEETGHIAMDDLVKRCKALAGDE